MYGGWDPAECLTANAEVATVLQGSILASSDTVESEGRQMQQCWIQNIESKSKKSSCLILCIFIFSGNKK